MLGTEYDNCPDDVDYNHDLALYTKVQVENIARYPCVAFMHTPSKKLLMIIKYGMITAHEKEALGKMGITLERDIEYYYVGIHMERYHVRADPEAARA